MSSEGSHRRPFHNEPIQLGDETLANLQAEAFPAGTILFHADERDDQLFIILSGEIELIESLNTPNERLISVRTAGELLGEMSVFQSTPIHRLSGRVRSDAHLLALPRSEVDIILRREPLLAYELLRVANGHLHRTHRRTTRVLEEKNQELQVAYEALKHAQKLLIAQERLQHELQLAREIQQQMLPAILPHMATVDLAARMIPANEVGGDFYDAFQLDAETLGLAIGDVCGKGMPAAIYMAQTRSLIRAAAEQLTEPQAVLERVNTHLRNLNSGGMFVTVIYATFHVPTRTLTLARAGHDYPFLSTTNRIDTVAQVAAGQPLGILANPLIDVQVRTLTPGDVLVLYTDGITEAHDKAGNLFEAAQLQISLLQHSPTTADAVCEHILAAVTGFRQAAPQADDMTLLVLCLTEAY